jgi:Fe-S cluster assembly iron-binding protein IscA
MKRVFVICVLVVGMVGTTMPGRAQFLKNLVNNVKQNIGNKAAGNAAGTTGKRDSASVAGKSGLDSAMVAQMLANATKPKPMTAADSAAVKSFMTATGGSGMLYEYRVVYDFKKNGKDSTITDTLSQAISEAHNTHVTMDMMGMKMQLLGRADQPRYSIVLYPDVKSYLLNIIDTAVLHADKMTYTVTRIGTETVAGYSCVHAKLSISTTGLKTPIVEDIWTSTGVPGYAEMKKLMTVHNITVKMLDALDQAGCNGFMVKMTMTPTGEAASSKDLAISTNMVLITAARRSFPASLFEIPAGYTAANSQSMFANMMATMPKQK